MTIDRFDQNSLTEQIASSELTYRSSLPVLRAVEARWPVHDGPVGVGKGGQLQILLHSLFCVQISLTDEHAQARLIGWDRDLTDQIQGARADRANIEALIGKIAEIVDRLRPKDVHEVDRPDAENRESRRARLSTSAALKAREMRERGESSAPETLSPQRVRLLIQQCWPDSLVTAEYGHGDDWEFSLRPYRSSQVVFGVEHRGAVGASTRVGRRIATLDLAGPSTVAGDEFSVTDLIGRVDSWLRRTMPPAWVLERDTEG